MAMLFIVLCILFVKDVDSILFSFIMISTMSSLKTSICWNLLSKKNDQINKVGVAVYQKQTSNTCYESKRKNEPPLCEEEANPNAAWYNLIYFDFPF